MSAHQDHDWHQPLTHCHCGRVIPCRHHDGAEGQGEGEKAGDRQWACDGCMAWLARADVSDWCDGEHVLCKSCDRPDTPAFR